VKYLVFPTEIRMHLTPWKFSPKYYIVYGEILENGEFIYNKPILSNDYYET
jgi:hypothetical protein